MKHYRNKFTKRLIEKTKIDKTSRILDLGCGTGSLTILLSTYISTKGEVIGVDNNQKMIDAANDNICQPNIKFIEADIHNLPDLGKFDIIIGRDILKYPSNEKVIEKIIPHLKEEGQLVFQENDNNIPKIQEKFTNHSKVNQMIHDTLKKENIDINIGSKLYTLFKNANLNIDELISEQILESIETGSNLAWKANLMKKQMIEEGIINHENDLNRYTKLLDQEMKNSNSIFIRGINYGIIGSMDI